MAKKKNYNTMMLLYGNDSDSHEVNQALNSDLKRTHQRLKRRYIDLQHLFYFQFSYYHTNLQLRAAKDEEAERHGSGSGSGSGGPSAAGCCLASAARGGAAAAPERQPGAVVGLVGPLGLRGAHPAEDAGEHGEHKHRGQHAEEGADRRSCGGGVPRRGVRAGHLVARQRHRRRRRGWCRWHGGRHSCSRAKADAVGGRW